MEENADKWGLVQISCLAVFASVYGHVRVASAGFVVEVFELGRVFGGFGVDWVFDVEGLSGW